MDRSDACWKLTVETDQSDLRDLINRLFSHDFPNISINHKHLSLDDEHALRQLEETVRFDPTKGHYVCGLPWKTSREGAMKVLNGIDSAGHARTRLIKATKRIKAGKTQMTWEQVQSQMKGIFDDGHASFIKPEDIPDTVPNWVLPMHFAYQPHKPTKPRCCQDGRSLLGGTCLNDNLLTGPDMLNSLIGIIFRFRRHQIVLSADIKGFFHQVFVDE